MTALEIALVALILIWTLIFIIIAVVVLIIYRSIKRALDKVNRLLDEMEEKAEEFDLPSKIVTASVIAFMAKQSFKPLMNFIGKAVSKKK